MSIVTFTTDFGDADGYVGAMKGVVLSRSRGSTLVDVCHNVPRHDIAAGAFALVQAAPYFPPGTIHVAVVDPGVGGSRAEVIVVAKNHIFVGPDNGLLTLAAPKPDAVFAIESSAFRRSPASATFAGRDVFAAAAGLLAAGAPPEDAGRLLAGLQPLAPRTPLPANVAGILHVDHFGNVITSLKAGSVPAGTKQLLINAGETGATFTWGKTFGDVDVGGFVAYEGSTGFIELAVRQGSAARTLNAAGHQTVQWEAISA
ncbi:MAG: SAM-dependent chlorinase/fluorinase [Deltaproteobacteria bacterium]|nr:SAM-dependent chlorinase/fluorinase [Deltaproteobacteria bacterium]